MIAVDIASHRVLMDRPIAAATINRLGRLDQHILTRRISSRILYRCDDLVEQRQVVEIPLRLKQLTARLN